TCRYAPHTNLTSSPTRRSSDLHRSDQGGPAQSVPPGADGEPAAPPTAPRRAVALVVAAVVAVTADAVEEAGETAPWRRRDVEERSEEHTSELQSQSKLVCRLLL